MRNPIKAALERKDIGSYDELACILMRQPDNAFEGDNSRSLASEIGRLDRGKSTWWNKRPALTDQLITFLELDAEDLGLARKSGRDIYVPEMFPDFPPLSLRREAIWTIAEAKKLINDMPVVTSRYYLKPTLDFWLTPGALGMGPSRAQWLCVADNVEFELLTRKLGAVTHHHILFETTISALMDKHADYVHHHKPLVVVIDGDGDGDDVRLLVEHRQRAPLLVISRHMLLLLPDIAEEGRSFDVARGAMEIESWVWTLLPNWREMVLDWIEKRFERTGTDTLFTSEAASDLLLQFDPGHQWFTRVEDVLVLAQAVADRREKGLKRLVGSGASLSALLTLLFDRDESNLGLTQQLVQARWCAGTVPWTGDISNDDWAMLATGLCPFDALAQFVTVRGDSGDFKRPIVIRLVLRDYLVRQLIAGNVGAWMPACFDEQRRPLLDAGLDALSLAELESLVLYLGGRLSLPDYLGVGETLFVAVGRRLVRGDAVGDKLLTVLTGVVRRLRWEQGLMIPYSRALITPGMQVEWVTICWAWSLAAQHAVDNAPSWQFPGWCVRLPDEVPRWLTYFGASYSEFSWDRIPLPMGNFLAVVRRWLKTFHPATCGHNTPPVFVVGLLAQAASGHWAARRDWWTAVIARPGAEEALLKEVVSDNRSDNRDTALAWWPSLVAYRHGEFAEMRSMSAGFGANLFTRRPGDHHFSPLLVWVMEQLEDDASHALSLLADTDRVFLAHHPAQLSVPFRRELLRAVPTMPGFTLSMFELPGFLHAYGLETCVEVEALLDHAQLGPQAAWALWAWAPRKTEMLLGQQRLTPDAVRNLLTSSPASALGPALAALAERTGLLAPVERLEWATRRLSDAREHAPALLRMIANLRLTPVP